MKLYEIKDWYMEKLTNRNWVCNCVEYNEDEDCFIDEIGSKWYPTICDLLIEDVWGIYKVPNKINKDDILEELDKEIDAIDTTLMNLRGIREAINLDIKE